MHRGVRIHYWRHALLAVSFIGVLAAPSASAATPVDEQALEERLGADVDLSDDTGRVSFIGAERADALPAPGDTPVETARNFLEDHAPVLGLDAEGSTLTTEGVTAAPFAGRAVRLLQKIDGVPVIGGEFVVNVTASGDVLSVGGESEPAKSLGTDPSVNAGDAGQAAVEATAAELSIDTSDLRAGSPELTILDSRILGGPDLGNPALVWRFGVTSPTNLEINQFVAIDAATGEVALQFSQTEYSKVRTVCDAGSALGGAQVPCTSPVSNPGGSSDADIKKAYDYAGATYDFYSSRFGRDSLDGAGLALKSTVHYCKPVDSTPAQCPYKNAYWSGTLHQMVYGEGYARADDVVGHELTHGVTEFTNGLEYYFQSGAINESMSDVFGEFIDFSNVEADDTAANRWIHGENKPPGTLRRNMKDPTHSFVQGSPTFTCYADKMTSPCYYADPNLTDSGGVHYNSGIGNKAAALISDGGTFNGRTVTGLGSDKASRIYYQVETNLLTSGSDYADLGNYLQQGCASLVGTAGITGANCGEVTDAVLATEMFTSPPAAPATEAPFCNAGSALSAVAFSDNLENPALVTANWSKTTLAGPAAYFTSAFNRYAKSGRTNFYSPDAATTGTGTVAMKTSFTVPAGGYFRFAQAYGFETGPSPGSTPYDGAYVQYSTNGGSGWTQVPGSWFVDNGYDRAFGEFSGIGAREGFASRSNGYISSRVNLAPLVGQSVRFRFVIGTDSSNVATNPVKGWFIDDISLYGCAVLPVAPPPPPPPVTPVATTKLTGAKIKGSKRQAKFTFTGTHATGFLCKLDGFVRSCRSPKTYRNLKPGKHTFRVKAVGPGGTDPTYAVKKFSIPKPKHRRR